MSNQKALKQSGEIGESSGGMASAPSVDPTARRIRDELSRLLFASIPIGEAILIARGG